MKVKIELDKCIGCGSCAAVCPESFDMGDDGKPHLKNGKKQGNNEIAEIKKEGCIKEAADICPVQCIKVE